MGIKKLPKMAEATVNVPMERRVTVGTKVLVYPGPGEAEILAIVTKIDELTGLIVEVSFKDENKKEKFLEVKNKIVTLVPVFYQLFKWIKNLFK